MGSAFRNIELLGDLAYLHPCRLVSDQLYYFHDAIDKITKWHEILESG
ncbi:hypothetical protein L903_22675 [Agrobacterium sp. JL28]|nr:hypothetical protein L904_23035 [Agrobacterium sp. LY4]KVK46800.1 hypothetical protein L903_22675 [Agrobacterium sp. JL28]KVK61122.1 hypothetical protein L906_21790 [Agrobacterium sp. TS45]